MGVAALQALAWWAAGVHDPLKSFVMGSCYLENKCLKSIRVDPLKVVEGEESSNSAHERPRCDVSLDIFINFKELRLEFVRSINHQKIKKPGLQSAVISDRNILGPRT